MTEFFWEKSAGGQLIQEFIKRRLSAGDYRGISVQLFRDGPSPPLLIGEARPGQAIDNETLFLVASLTKPVVATAVLKLAEQGLFSLNERVSTFLPEWNRGERRRITIRQLLCHASGLPDQLPDHQQMRNNNAPLREFYDQTVKVPLEFSPGSKAQYQSMGYLTLGVLLEKLLHKPCGEILQELIFTPLKMSNSFLGLADDTAADSVLSRVAKIELDEEQEQQPGNWNSAYWQRLGAPWGGMISNTTDMLKFCMSQLLWTSEGKSHEISDSLIRESCQNQLVYFDEMSRREREFRPWGLGWRLNWKAHRETFGDFLSAAVVGHWGATGTLMWIDRQQKTACVICATRPTDSSRVAIIRLSNLIASVINNHC